MLTRSPNPTDSPEHIRERVLDLVWSLWVEMGIPGWSRRHQDWALDPEPLILFTAGLGEADLRLRDECIRWCVRNSRYIATARLRNLLGALSSETLERWGPFAATVNAHGDAGWPRATESLLVKLSPKDSLDDFGRPALISLRLRTIVGVSARSEILRYFIARPDARATAADLSEVVHYSKRNVEKELEALRKAGMLGVERVRNRLEHFISQPDSLLLFGAPRPGHFPRWDAIFNVLGALMDYEERLSSMDPAVAAVEARRVAREITSAVRQGRLPPLPGQVAGHTIPASLREWGGHVTEALARADAKSLGWASVEPVAAPDWRAGRTEGVRSVVSPILATATDLAVWADTRTAQEGTHDLIRRLILATANGLGRIDLGAGEAVQQGGFDGVVANGAATPFVPAGASVWEIGVSANVKGKADSDYEKRSANPLGVDPSHTTFVFVTPRRWASKRVWEKARKQDHRWRDVRALDADDLESWLGLAPAVHSWLSALLGKSWGSVHDLRSYWSDWREATDPPLSAEVVLAGREKTAEDLRKRIDEASSLVRVQGESANEALAFIAAAMQGMAQADSLLARSLVVSDAAGWNWAANSASSLVLIPRYADPNTTHAIRQGHRVVIPVGREEGLPDDLVVPRPRRDALKLALLGIGASDETVNDLAARGRASLTSLRRRLGGKNGLERPAWAHRAEAPALLPALLAGAWDETKPGDQEVISRLAERPYQDVERSLARWALASDAPVRKVGTRWYLVAKEDSWRLLSPHLTSSDIARFSEALLRALEVPDPALDLPPDKRWMANVFGHHHPISAYLREGLVDTLAIMGAHSGETTFLTGNTGQWHADTITGDLLNRANNDASRRLWASLSGVLPLLAEAAPEQFLDAVDVALSREPSPLLALFVNADTTTMIFANSPHTGLLWALESLSWSTDYLGRATQLLATLDRFPLSDKLGNRPMHSLRSIFLTWNPQTVAPLSSRLAALDILRKKEPDTAWSLMLAIVPKRHDISAPSYAPRWRDWKDLQSNAVPNEEYNQAIEEVISRLLCDVGISGKRWNDLIGILGDLPWNKIVSALECIASEVFSEEDRTTVWRALRSEISIHRGFPNAEWARPAALMDRLEHIYERLAPSDPVQRVAWLFTQNPGLLEGEREDWASHLQAVQKARLAAIQNLREHGGLVALLRLAQVAEKPEEVGLVIGQTVIAETDDEQATLLDLLDAPDTANLRLALGYATKRFDVEGWEWARPLLEHTAKAWSPEKRAAFLRALPFAPETWDWAERFGEDTQRAYWLGAWANRINEPADVERAAKLFVRFGRAASAIDLLGLLLHGAAPEIDPDLVATALEQLLQQGVPSKWTGLAHDVAALLDYLATSGTVDVSRHARLEWIFLPLLRGLGRSATVLSRELAQHPEFFVEILCLIFRAHDEEPRETTEEQQSMATLGYQLLDSWRRPPGIRDDGTVDEDALNAWVNTARSLAARQKREVIADQQIGRVLRYLPDDPDGLWPHRAVRNLVECIESHDLETGLEIGLHNSRGATWRDLTDGGAQERVLQTQYLDLAQQANANWPRTAAMLRRIARSFAAEARRHDEEAEITEDHWR